MGYSDTLRQLGITLPSVPTPVGAYVPAVRTGSLVFVAGQLPVIDGRLSRTGKLGADLTIEDGAGLARLATLNALAAIAAALGSLDRVVRTVRLGGFVASAPGFTDQAKVVNGASELLHQVFGDAGLHARYAVGVAELPLGAPVEIELVVEVTD